MKRTKDNRTNLEKEIDRLIDSMSLEDPNSDEYAAQEEKLEKLIGLRVKLLQAEKSSEARKKIDPNVIISIVGELLGMGLIMNFERLHIITTKAFGRLWRTR